MKLERIPEVNRKTTLAEWVDLHDSGRVYIEEDRKVVTDQVREMMLENRRLKKVLKMARRIVRFRIDDAVLYKATHNALEMSPEGKLVLVNDPIRNQYKILESQFIPMFEELKNAVLRADDKKKRRK